MSFKVIPTAGLSLGLREERIAPLPWGSSRVTEHPHNWILGGGGGGGQLSQRCFDLFDDVQRSPGRSALTSLKWHLGSIDSLLQGGISMGENMLSNP